MDKEPFIKFGRSQFKLAVAHRFVYFYILMVLTAKYYFKAV